MGALLTDAEWNRWRVEDCSGPGRPEARPRACGAATATSSRLGAALGQARIRRVLSTAPPRRLVWGGPVMRVWPL